MKRLRSSDDLNSFGEKGGFRDWARRDEESSLSRSSSHRSFHYKPENGRKGSASFASRYDRLDDDRENSRLAKKRSDYESEGYDRRMCHDRYRDGSDRGILSSSPRSGYSGDRMHRSESFSALRREIPKGFRSERDRSRREGSISSWRRFGTGKDTDDGPRSHTDTAGGNKVVLDDKGNSRVQQKPREAKSPPCSKDSGSEQPRGIKTTKTGDLQAETCSGSEREEGELEPEPEPEAGRGNVPVAEGVGQTGLSSDQSKLKNEEKADDKISENEAKSVSSVELYKDCVGGEKQEDEVKSLPELNYDKDGACEEKPKFESQRSVKQLVKTVEESPNNHRDSVQELLVNEDAIETIANIRVSNEEKRLRENNVQGSRDRKIEYVDESMPLKEENEGYKVINHKMKDADIGFHESPNGFCETSKISNVGLPVQMNSISQGLKDKGKNVAVSLSPADATDLAEGQEAIKGTNQLLTFEAIDKEEGPSSRGLDLFLNHPVKQPEKQYSSGCSNSKEEKLELEPLDLSLSLPNVLFPIDSQNKASAPGSPSHARSIHSMPSTFRTNSDGFTTSMSFSGSQSFRHNPSCSLTNMSLDNFEHSVSSRPLFHGVDKVSPTICHGQPSNDRNQKEVPMFQKVLSSDRNGCLHQSKASNSREIQDQQPADAKGSSGSTALDRQLSLHRQLSTKSPLQRVRSYEHSENKRRVMGERVSSNSHKSDNSKEEQIFTREADSIEPIITMIVSEPVHVMVKGFNEISGQAIVRLKEGVRDIIVNAGKQRQLSIFQKALSDRTDINLETLLKFNRALLEILVALRIGIGEFLQRNNGISSSDMAEIYLNLRCRNLTCRNLLPVDDCDCKICSRKNGFCSNCMCLVCSKYDMASNTCSWVGCDVCLHWCHADCAIQESYIRNGRSSASGPYGPREMQFHCVACGHPSEMFGFVKEVFQTFAKGWTAEALSNELEYVRKIFSASEDMRGKRLHDIAVQMLARLANKCELQEVQNQIMGFLSESCSMKSDNPTVSPGKEPFNRNQGGNSKNGPSQEAVWRKPLSSGKAQQLETTSSFKSYQNNHDTADPDLQRSVPKEHVFTELESIVRIKEAEAKMFQTRADDARREAEGLKRIATAKNQRIEEEHKNRISKLRLPEAEEMRKQKVEHLQVLERAHLEYLNMKMRMEADIRDLLSKMEATKRNLAM